MRWSSQAAVGGVPSHSSKLGSFIIHGGRTNAEHAAVIPEDLGHHFAPNGVKMSWELEKWTYQVYQYIMLDNIETI